ncbi:aspartyl protease family protein [Ferruginibacter sp. SUN106]|uniref:aspartyl protease family protein n=1 Tax=Ferruginibacter sp. SUN106 TaxID=2978348 RepID=UPI003D35FAE9
MSSSTIAAHHCTDSVPPKKITIVLQSLQEALATDSVTCTIPFSRAGNLILLRAKADTTEGNFILDTGAPGLVLNITYFRDYTSTTDINEEQSGITGSASGVKKTQVGELTFGCIKTGLEQADLLSLGHLENTKGVKILGLIGLSLFKQFEMIIDYENNLLYLHRYAKKIAAIYKNPMLEDTSKYSVVPIEIWNNKMVVRTVMAGKKLRLIIDSGAESNVLDSRLPNKIFENVEVLRRVQLLGTGDKKVDALYGNLNNLTIGDQNTGSLPVLITNLEKTCLADNSCIDGILGFDFLSLHKIGFNFVNNKMYIWK